jgi:hypothetical protein
MRRSIIILVGLLVVALVLPAAVSAKPPTRSPVTRAVTGTTDVGSLPVTGTFEFQRFAKSAGGIVAIGTFTGTVGAVTGSQTIAWPVDLAATGATQSGLAAAAACDILNLVLGPLDLNLLGLEVHLNQVVLDIVAQPGAGNLLGNLLCAVAGLLDGPGPLGQIAALLNQILSILQTL